MDKKYYLTFNHILLQSNNTKNTCGFHFPAYKWIVTKSIITGICVLQDLENFEIYG